MKASIIEFLFKQFLSFVGVTTNDMWEKTKELVKRVATDLATKTGAERREAVVAELKAVYTTVAPYLINFIVEAAVAFLKAKAAI
jgi:hypothetical protein